MKFTMGFLAASAVVVALVSFPGEAPAQSEGAGLQHPASAYYRGQRTYQRSYRNKRGARVRGYVVSRGGYSFSAADVANTYGDARTRYGSNNFYRDPMTDRQTSFGPFDNGFFFDSGVAPRGGNAVHY